MDAPKIIEWSLLPEKYRQNWHIYLYIVESFRIEYCCEQANKAANKAEDESKWCAEFDAASKTWLEFNRPDPVWSSGKWYEKAEVYLGSKIQELALKAVLTRESSRLEKIAAKAASLGLTEEELFDLAIQKII